MAVACHICGWPFGPSPNPNQCAHHSPEVPWSRDGARTEREKGLALALAWLVSLETARPRDYDEQKLLAMAAARGALEKHCG